jgi:hypothetical protein
MQNELDIVRDVSVKLDSAGIGRKQSEYRLTEFNRVLGQRFAFRNAAR